MSMGYCDWTSSMGTGTNPDAPEHRRPDPPPPPPNETMVQGVAPRITKYDPCNYEAPPKRRPKYVLELASAMSDQALANLRKSLDGVFAPGEVIVLEQGLKLRPIDGKPQDELKTLHVADIIDVTHKGAANREYIHAVTGERMYKRSDGKWQTEKEKRAEDAVLRAIRQPPQQIRGDEPLPADPWAPRHAWKLALATAAVWVAAIVTGVSLWN